MTVLGETIKNLRIDFLKEARIEEQTRKKLPSADNDVQSFREEKKRAHIKYIMHTLIDRNQGKLKEFWKRTLTS